MSLKFKSPINHTTFILFLLVVVLLQVSCKTKKSEDKVAVNETPAATSSTKKISTVKHPDWAKDMIIYEVNVRNYSKEGTFAEFEKHLPRLKELGVNVLWFMPVQPVGEEKKKGSYGSPYAISDYEAINPRMGDMEEFKALVKKIHDMDMRVLIEWVGNHASWDNVLTKSHPDWFDQDENGSFVPPRPDWEDVIEVNYKNPELYEYMQNEIIRWVKETDIDGFRFDVAGMMPQKFWEDLKPKLDAVKPLFVFTDGVEIPLAEKALNMIYTYEMIDIMTNVAKGESDVSAIDAFLKKEQETYPDNTHHFYFTSGHVPNSFTGTVFERLGDGAAAFAVLNATLHGISLLYSGQEAGMEKRLSFYDKDLIEWKEHEFEGIYQKLFKLKKENKALWNGASGGEVQRIKSSNDKAIFAFTREKDANKVLIVINLSSESQKVKMTGDINGNYTELFTQEKTPVSEGSEFALGPWEYMVYVAD